MFNNKNFKKAFKKLKKPVDINHFMKNPTEEEVVVCIMRTRKIAKESEDFIRNITMRLDYTNTEKSTEKFVKEVSDAINELYSNNQNIDNINILVETLKEVPNELISIFTIQSLSFSIFLKDNNRFKFNNFVFEDVFPMVLIFILGGLAENKPVDYLLH
ncbi:MAG: hypothetical protein [Bacteriophage sp.]|nr:MAG: hypothetical protein [Bacteriophage sp.]